MASSPEISRWDTFEAAFDDPASGNPFTEVELYATFSQGNREVRVTGFYDGNGTYRVRFMPDTEGAWRYRTASNVAALNGLEGALSCVAARGGHGPVRVSNRHHFAHADGTPYFPFGTTCYAWTHQDEATQAQTLATLAETRFNSNR